MKIKKNDTVLIMSGKERGKSGKVIKIFPKKNRAIVEGINIRKRHLRPRRIGSKGEIIQMAMPIHISNLKLICPKCGKPVRLGYYLTEKTKSRVCKKCRQEI